MNKLVIAAWKESSEALCEQWNKRFPVGTRVRYFEGSRNGMFIVTNTCTPAQLLCGGVPVVWLYDVSGCVALTHVEPLPPEESLAA